MPVRAACCAASSVASSSKTLWRPFSSGAVRQYAESSSSTSSDGDAPPAEELPPAGDKEQEATPLVTPPTASSGPEKKGFRAWLKGEGSQFKLPIRGRTNWIGQTPFPMNPTFNPKPPLPDAIKTKIYNAYLYNSQNADRSVADSVIVRAVSTKFGVSMDRVRAVIRLKELEASWKAQGKPLQTELLKGMESHLGVKQPGEHWKGTDQPDPDAPLLGSKKTVFEMLDVESDEESVFLPMLEKVKNKPRASVAAAAQAEDDAGRTKEVDRILFRNLDGTAAGREWHSRYESRNR